MRAKASLLLFSFAITLSLPLASAQDGCTQADPCDWIVSFDDTGFLDAPAGGWNFTAGDWVVADLFNEGDTSQTVTLDGQDLSETLAPLERRVSAPFAWSPGTDTVRIEPSGATASIHVIEGDIVAAQEAAANKDSPAVSLAIVLLGMVVLARRP